MSSEERKDALWNTVNYYIRVEYYNKSQILVPTAIRNLILTFSDKIIKSDILSIKADVNLVSKFKGLIPNYNNQTAFTKLFKASEHQYRASKYHEAVDFKPKTITIIKSGFGGIFGAYASAALEPSDMPSAAEGIGRPIWDSTVFLFGIDKEAGDEAKIFNKNNTYPGQDRRCITYDPSAGPGFGLGDVRIRDKCHQKAILVGGGKFISPFSVSHCGNFTFDLGEGADRTILCGSLDRADKAIQEAHDKLYPKDISWENNDPIPGNPRIIYVNYFTVLEYEVFQMHPKRNQ